MTRLGAVKFLFSFPGEESMRSRYSSKLKAMLAFSLESQTFGAALISDTIREGDKSVPSHVLSLKLRRG
jgi:hypothetical protein